MGIFSYNLNNIISLSKIIILIYNLRKYFDFFGSNQRNMYFSVFLTCKIYRIFLFIELVILENIFKLRTFTWQNSINIYVFSPYLTL